MPRSTPRLETVADFVRRHSGLPEHGEQCPVHPSICHMATNEQLAALLEETGEVVTRQWLTQLCNRLGVPRQAKVPRSPDQERKLELQRARFHRWYKKKQGEGQPAQT